MVYFYKAFALIPNLFCLYLNVQLSWANAVLSRSERSESVGVIVFACEMCIAEIKRLQIPVSQGNDLVDMFSALRNDIGARLSNSLIASTGSRY